MKWFDDVWLKEVFANFMADKIVRPLYPKFDHDLGFFFSNYPMAYGVDRTLGMHPIHQELSNLNRASLLYGAIIYQKAPIVMKQLERLLGEEKFRAGLVDYLTRFSYGNATWSDLIAILQRHSVHDLAQWSSYWVESSGRPELSVQFSPLAIETRGPRVATEVWPQTITLAMIAEDNHIRKVPVVIDKGRVGIEAPKAQPKLILSTAQDPGYGIFALSPESLQSLRNCLTSLADEKVRAVAWVTLWENLMEKRVHPVEFITLAITALPLETNAFTTDYVLGRINYAFWAFLSEAERDHLSSALEPMLWKEVISGSRSAPGKVAFFRTYRSVMITASGWDNLYAHWSGERHLEISLAGREELQIAYELALRKPAEATSIQAMQRNRIKSPQLRAEFDFVFPSAGGTVAARDALFARLLTDEGRKNEPWVDDALYYLHHPLHGPDSEKYLDSSLELLPRTFETGGVFFPLNWANGSLRFHVSPRGRTAVETYLSLHPSLERGLRQKLLQAAGDILRFE